MIDELNWFNIFSICAVGGAGLCFGIIAILLIISFLAGVIKAFQITAKRRKNNGDN